MDHVLPQDSRPEGVAFLFDGGVIDEADMATMVFGDGEISSADFYALTNARPRMKPLVADRLATGLDAAAEGVTVLCEHGRRIPDGRNSLT